MELVRQIHGLTRLDYQKRLKRDFEELNGYNDKILPIIEAVLRQSGRDLFSIHDILSCVTSIITAPANPDLYSFEDPW